MCIIYSLYSLIRRFKMKGYWQEATIVSLYHCHNPLITHKDNIVAQLDIILRYSKALTHLPVKVIIAPEMSSQRLLKEKLMGNC